MGAMLSFFASDNPNSQVIEEQCPFNNILQEKSGIHDNKESSTMDLSTTNNVEPPCEMDQSSNIFHEQDKKDTFSSSNCEALISIDPSSPSEPKIITRSLQGREDNKAKKKKCNPPENDMEQISSLKKFQDNDEGIASDSFLDNVCALDNEMKMKEEDWPCNENTSVDDTTTCGLSHDNMPQKNEEVFVELDRAKTDSFDVVGVKIDSDLTDCLNEAENNTEKTTDEQEKLLQAIIPSELTPIKPRRRKLLILDVNGLLVDVVDNQPDWHKPDTRVSRKSVYKRPFCIEFLKFCMDAFDVGVWSSRVRRNLDAIVDFLLGDEKNKLLFCWDQTKCTATGFNTIENRRKPLFLKELRKIWDKEEPDLPWEKGEFAASNTLLLDDSPYKALLNPPHTAIFPRPYCFKDEHDASLGPGGDLRIYLEELSKADNVPSYVRDHPFGQNAITQKDPSWSFYDNVINIMNSSAPDGPSFCSNDRIVELKSVNDLLNHSSPSEKMV